jgi:hypothetical protein
MMIDSRATTGFGVKVCKSIGPESGDRGRVLTRGVTGHTSVVAVDGSSKPIALHGSCPLDVWFADVDVISSRGGEASLTRVLNRCSVLALVGAGSFLTRTTSRDPFGCYVDQISNPNSETSTRSTTFNPPPLNLLKRPTQCRLDTKNHATGESEWNLEVLLALGFNELKNYVPPKKEAVLAAKSRKRKSPPLRDTKDGDRSDAKVSRTRAARDITNTSGVRRSARNAGKVIDYKNEPLKPSLRLPLLPRRSRSIVKARAPRNVATTRMWAYFPAVMKSLTAACNVGNSVAIFLTSRLAIGGRPGALRVQTPSMREWSMAPSKLHTSLSSHPLSRGLPESLRGKMVPTQSVSQVNMTT